MKKLISLLLNLTLIFTLSVPALAYESDFLSSDKIILRSDGHGQFTVINAAPYSLKNGIESSDNSIVATATEDREIYHYKDDQYLVQANDNTYILTDEVVVDIDDYAANETTFNRYNISDDMREEMDAVITAQKALGNDDLEIVVYAPSHVSSGIHPCVNEPIGTTYYKYYANGITYNMKNYTVAYRNLSTGIIEKKGTGTLSQAKAWTNFVVSAVGAVSKTVGAFGIFSSAYEAYKASKGTVVTGSSGDHMYTNLVYDRLMKETYAADIYSDYILGCVSYKVWLNRHDNYQYYGSTGRSYSNSDTLNTEHYSEHFNYPSPTAVQNAGGGYYIDGFQYTKVFGKTVRLMGT